MWMNDALGFRWVEEKVQWVGQHLHAVWGLLLHRQETKSERRAQKVAQKLG